MRVAILLILNALLSGCVVSTVGSAVTGAAGMAAGVAGTAVKAPFKIGAKVVGRPADKAKPPTN